MNVFAGLIRVSVLLVGIILGAPLAILRAIWYTAWGISTTILTDVFSGKVMTSEEYENYIDKKKAEDEK